MIYTNKLENHKLGHITPSEKAAKANGWTLAFENEQVEKSEVDNCWYEKGFAPKYTDAEKLQQAKDLKFISLKSYHNLQLSQSKILSSTGFSIDANDKAATDLQGLSSLMSSTNTASIDNFRDATNTLQTVSTAQVNTMELEVQRNEQVLRAKKQAVTSLINSKSTAADVNAIDIAAEYAKSVNISFPTITSDMQPKTGIDVKTDGAKIARALEWIGGTGQALSASAIQGLNKADFGTSEQAITMLGAGYKSYMHEFTGTGDIVQTMPNITNEDDSFTLLVRNSKTSGNVTLNVGGISDTIDGQSSYTLKPNHSVLMMSVKSKLRWVILNETELDINNKPVYIESDVSVKIPTNSSRVVLAFQGGTQGTITQSLPDLDYIQMGTVLQIRNLRTEEIELIPYAGQQVTGASSYIIQPQTDIFLLAEGQDWFLWLEEDLSKSVTPLQATGSDINSITSQYPVQLQVNKDTKQLKLGIDPAAFMQKDGAGIYMCLSQDEEVVGRPTDSISRSGKIYCDEAIYATSGYVHKDPVNKAIILEDFSDDPNVSGGTPYLVASVVTLKGNANEDINVTAQLWSKFQEEGAKVLTDISGKSLSVTKQFKQGEAFSSIINYGIIMVKGSLTIGMSLSHTGKSDNPVLVGRARRGCAIMAQALTENARTGLPMLAFEQDYNTKFFFTRRYLGQLASIGYLLQNNIVQSIGQVKDGMLNSDGWALDNITQVSAGVQDKTLSIKSTPSNVADFFFGYIFDSVTTKDILGKNIDVELQIADSDNSYQIYVLAYKGQQKPVEVMASRVNTNVVWTTGWTEVAKEFVMENPTGNFFGKTHSFTMPADADYLAVGIAPVNAQNPTDLQLKQFNISMVKPEWVYDLETITN